MPFNDVIMAGDVIRWVIILGIVVAFLSRIISVYRKNIAPLLHKLNTMANDFNGSHSRPGVERTPGVMERLAKLESHDDNDMRRFDSISETMESIKKQLDDMGGPDNG